MKKGIKWMLCNGRRIRFWEDNWVIGEEALQAVANGTIPENQVGMTVSNFITTEGQWNWGMFGQLIPTESMLRVAAMLPPYESAGEDGLVWNISSSGQFTTRSAYDLIEEEGQKEEDKVWQLVWGWHGPQRVRSFMWLAVHNKLLTNKARLRRHLTDNPKCGTCKITDEDVLHVLRDCPRVTKIWKDLVNTELKESFTSANTVKEWITNNLSMSFGRCNKEKWALLFGITIWKLWNWRNHTCFRNSSKVGQEMVNEIKRMACEVEMYAPVNMAYQRRKQKEKILVGWKRPPEGWVKVNTDGASKGNPGRAGAGGLVRDAGGNWLGGFSANIGICSSYRAELWAVKLGLSIVWERGFRKAILEVDSAAIAQAIKQAGAHRNRDTLLVEIGEILKRPWEIMIHHQLREGNRSADCLANMAFEAPVGVQIHEAPPRDIQSLLRQDMIAFSIARLVSLYFLGCSTQVYQKKQQKRYPLQIFAREQNAM